jgi:hypothetical protein
MTKFTSREDMKQQLLAGKRFRNVTYWSVLYYDPTKKLPFRYGDMPMIDALLDTWHKNVWQEITPEGLSVDMYTEQKIEPEVKQESVSYHCVGRYLGEGRIHVYDDELKAEDMLYVLRPNS